MLGDAYNGQADKHVSVVHIPACAPRLSSLPFSLFSLPFFFKPQAIRSSLDVHGENAPKIVPIDSPQFGRVFAVCVGTIMVGSIRTTSREEGTGIWLLCFR